jgi:hypothetical protein
MAAGAAGSSRNQLRAAEKNSFSPNEPNLPACVLRGTRSAQRKVNCRARGILIQWSPMVGSAPGELLWK